MIQTEYENPDRPVRRLPSGSVVIEDFHMWSHEYTQGGKLIKVRVYHVRLFGGLGWTYRTHPEYDNGVLYTMDDHGNIKSPSVFREPLEA